MVYDKNIFTALDENKGGMINTSCGYNTLKIEGKGTIQVSHQNQDLIFQNVLYVPKLAVNLLSLQQLLIEQFVKLDTPSQQSHISSAELLHKSLGHVSYSRIRQKLGIPIKAPHSCKACAVVKVTKASFGHRSLTASKPLEELHLDLIGPISPLSRQLHKIGYYPSVLHSDRGTEFANLELGKYCHEHIIRQRFSDAYTPQQNGLAERFNRTIIEALKTNLADSGLPKNLWHEVLSSSVLALNQIPAHRSKKSPYELFKGHPIALEFFCPVGNPVAIVSNKNKSKLEPRGELGKLLGFNAEMKSYRILTSNGRILDSKHVDFLDYTQAQSSPDFLDNIQIEKRDTTPEVVEVPTAEVKEEVMIKEELEEEEPMQEDSSRGNLEEEDSADDEADIEEILIPAPIKPSSRILQDQTIKVIPVKYTHMTHLTFEPKTFKIAVSGANAQDWRKAINAELDNIKQHDVWLDQLETPEKVLHSTWVFKIKPATLSSPEKPKAQLCIQGFLQTHGEDFFDTFAPTGKFPSLLTLLVLAIDLRLPVKQFDVKSAFLFGPLEEEIYIKMPEGSSKTASYLRLVKSLYGLKQAPKNWYQTLTTWFQEIDYAPSVSDACLFIHRNKELFIFFHVDDLIVVGKPDEFEELFLSRFPNSTAHIPDTLLGMNLIMSTDCVELLQPALIEKGLELLKLEECKPVKTPLTPAVQLKRATDEDHQAFLKLGLNY
ncbi:hypothetical protein PCANC_05107 [Puccinia coronata f. sp. avenae]|uniref:Integrase catalytic domain-containing protein n=1 Tax=Puccinia coronata f. sp. avenae TaxID=200324 RepID=A0A2N5W371_9BASI|nr:hypothetical protein PCANC_05107 [Puccinia coronata f. sp. avenae]